MCGAVGGAGEGWWLPFVPSAGGVFKTVHEMDFAVQMPVPVARITLL